ncbi:hypothetical protein M501DRAFT_1059598 [Patellaria atrata CBS 101060]|uniref:Uncharacterized protein n=1 Tax=Patellaria atrata CBS 101060 TaxID=1346257 RepID=A0A9P4VPV2_9PEZI|nr:hypothetical protein M501DRAFT_1059598 [Patellaria atrata CBS 101060]
MSHMLVNRILGQEIHFGLRKEGVVIRALTKDGLLQYVPCRVFTNEDSVDIPLSLIQDCVHWANINSRHIEFRRKPAIWKTRPGNWVMDLTTRHVRRRNSLLVDPHSDLFRCVAGIFGHFEETKRFTSFQPHRGLLSVEIRHLELSFFGNSNGLLQCRELQAEMDPNQDAGTWYGLESKVVLRDIHDTERRSIIAALGALKYQRRGMHVTVRATTTNEYGRFWIDNLLGRLLCPPEPRLLHSKAQFHAFTSFVLPDPLTGRTGTEEAFHTLRSGYCQPWVPLNDDLKTILKAIKRLSPQREYYPEDKRKLQQVKWDKSLTMLIQHENCEPLVEEILRKSNRLQAFTQLDQAEEESDHDILSHLRKRVSAHRLIYERDSSIYGINRTVEDTVYQPRDRNANLVQSRNVYQVVKLLLKRPFSIPFPKMHFTAMLGDWKLIGRFGNDPNCLSHSMIDLIESNIAEKWGSPMDVW